MQKNSMQQQMPTISDNKIVDNNTPKDSIWKWIFVGLAITSLVTIILLCLSAGNSGDEHFHLEQAEHVYNYYATGGQDSTAAVVTPQYNLPYYGQCVDNFAYFVTKIFNIENIFEARHIINSICGWLAMFFAALIVYRIAGWRGAVFTLLLFFFSPRFLGHSFNNLKDLPLATGTVFGLYCLTRFLQEFPKIKWSTAILFAISISFATAVRFAGILIVAYFGLFGLIFYLQRNWKLGLLKQQGKSEFGKLLVWGLGISAVGIILTILLWPFLLKHPIDNFKDTVENMSSFAIAIRQVFEGSLQWSDALSWYYTPKYILMTIPIAVIVGLLLFFIFCWRKKEDRFWSFFVFFTFFFPVFWIVYTRANVYGGWRHAMFAYPPMVVAAGMGFDSLVRWIENKVQGVGHKVQDSNNEEQQNAAKNWKPVMVNIGAVVVLLALLIGPIRHIVANHPYEYVYFNELAGGIDKAYGNYELDYYYHSTREASEWIIANAEPNADGSKIKVATWHLASVAYFFRNDTAKFQPLFCRWYEKGNNDWDYAIFTITGMAPEQITHAGAFPPPDCVHTINVDDKPICIILKRQSKDDFIGNQYKSKNQADSAILCFQKALQINPYNEAALNNIIECYLMKGQLDSAKIYIDQELSFLPKYETGNYFLAHYYMTKGDMDNAIKTCKYIIDCNFKFSGAYHLMCNIYLRQNDVANAEKTLLKLIDVDQLDDAGVQQLIQIYKAEGLDDRGAYRKLYKKMATSLDKRDKKKEAQTYWDLYHQLR